MLAVLQWINKLMREHDVSQWLHSHRFHRTNQHAERGAQRVVLLSAVMMVVEIVVGWWSGSMALLADGWHMSSHTLAIGLSAGAYWLARRYADDSRFVFGTWKIEILGGFASAILLGLVALLMVGESVLRLWSPVQIYFNEAIAVAALGLAVNLLSAVWLDDHHHHHHGSHDHGHDHGHDLNQRAAFLHVLADALTSVCAIVALIAGKYLGWVWLDPLLGVVGGVVVGVWAWGLLRQTGYILLDWNAEAELMSCIRRDLEQSQDDVHISDLHVWQVGQGQYACIASLVAHSPIEPYALKARLEHHPQLVHITVEINRCQQCG